MDVEVSHLSTVGNQVADSVQGIGLDHGGEGDHLALSTRMPDHTLDEPLSSRGAGVEVNLSGRVGQLHRVSLDYLVIIQATDHARETAVQVLGLAHPAPRYAPETADNTQHRARIQYSYAQNAQMR